jgi:hypothetical protein
MERTGEIARATATASPPAAPRAARWYSIGLCSTAVAAGAALVVAGSPLPTLGPLLLLAIAAALCVNRFALFPSEYAATAEAAVLLAAVVGFRSSALFLGPLAVALLVGPLDALHWEQRSFVRMAFNAGNRGVATLVAALVFAGCRDITGRTTVAWVLAVLLSATAFTVVDIGCSTLLGRLHGERFRVALEHLLDVDVLTLPIALAGATAGILATEVGWWAAVLALLPAAFVPELVIARARVRAMAVRDIAALLSVVALLATVALVTPASGTATLAVLCLLAVLLGIEVAPARGALLPPLVALVVIPACAVLAPDRVRVGAVVVAVVTTATSWWCERSPSRLRVLAALALAVGVAGVTAQLALELPRTVDGLVVGALVSGVAFEVVALLLAPRRRRTGVSLAWALPVLGVVAAGAAVWRAVGLSGAVVVGVLATVALLGWAAWGAPTWRSRVAVRAAMPLAAPLVVGGFVLVAVLAVLAAVVGVSARDHTAAEAWAWTAAGLAEVGVAMSAAGVRQWRFAPWPRRWGLATVVVAAGVVLGVGAPLVADGSAWGPVAIGATMAVVVLAARTPARLLQRAPVHDGDGMRAR